MEYQVVSTSLPEIPKILDKYSISLSSTALDASPAQARGAVPNELRKAMDRAVDICLALISRAAPGQLGKLRKSETGYVHIFPGNRSGILDSGYQLNATSAPRVEIFCDSEQVCSVYALRLDGGYWQHFSLLREAFARRCWNYKQGTRPTMAKDKRLMSPGGGTTTRGRSSDV